MIWKAAFGHLAARVVQAVALVSRAPSRSLTQTERELIAPIYESSVDLSKIRIRENVRGLLNASRRAFVIEETMFLPSGYLPLRSHILVHEVCHVWQFQNGGHAYIGDSVHAQLLGDGYELEKGLLQGRGWAELNAEQQATLIEASFTQGCFEGKPFLVRGRDWTEYWRTAVTELRAGRGAAFTPNEK
ncbi:MAG: hypothetical protein Q8K32_11390 [Archangium sp.]|nr:hypothetical protein [Archangium sp.]